MTTTETVLETPSGKNESTENFPVGSRLLPAHLRPHVMRFYQFARAIDDIADNNALPPDDKIDRLQRFADALEGGRAGESGLEKAHVLRHSLLETGVTTQHGLDLIAAFKQDAVKSRYDDWDDLMAYCRLSASPVGRYLLDLHGEDKAGYPSSDALCDALQVINHLQDCQDDFHDMDRVYLSQAWMAREGCDPSHLSRNALSPEMRRVVDMHLEGVENLLDTARALPSRLRDTRLAMESSVIVVIADKLTGMLRGRDPLATRVKLNRWQFAGCLISGIGRVAFGRFRGRPTSAN